MRRNSRLQDASCSIGLMDLGKFARLIGSKGVFENVGACLYQRSVMENYLHSCNNG